MKTKMNRAQNGQRKDFFSSEAKKKLLELNSAKLTALSIGLLLAVFCTIGMSFRPVYDEQEVADIVMSGPRRSHWTTTTTSGCSSTTTYYNKTDYAKTVAQSLNVSYGTVEITENSKNAVPVTATNGSQSYVEWDTGLGTSQTTGQRNDLEVIHTNTITFTATPTDLDEYYFVGWYSDAEGTNLVSGEGESPWKTDVKFDAATGITSYGSSEVQTYQSSSSRWTKTYYAKFAPIPSIDVTFLAASPARDNGYYTVTGKGVSKTITTSNQTIGVKGITLTAYPTEAALFVRWFTEDGSGNRTTLSTDNPCVVSFTAATKVGVEWEELTNNHMITFKAVDLDANDTPVGTYTIGSTELSTTIGASDYVYNTGEAYKFMPTLTATPAANYMFYGWYTRDGAKKNYLSYSATWSPTFTEDIILYAEFLFNGYATEDLAMFKVGNNTYTDLNAANAACNNTNKTITLIRDGILPPGNYTIDAANTLLIPYNEEGTMVTSESSFASMANQTFTAVSAYKTLTFAKGANLTVDGTLYVAAQQFSSTTVMKDASGGPGRPIGPVGRIHMAEGGHIEVNGKLYCFGFITGQNMADGNNTLDVGTISANSGSTIYENFIMGDMRGGRATYTMADKYTDQTFPFNSYFIQNIEVPLSIKYGATEKCVTSVNPSGTNSTTTVLLIGSGDAMFKITGTDGVVTKWYDATSDHFCIQLSGSSMLNKMSVSMSISGISKTIKSENYILPIPSSMHIILDDCNVTLGYDIGLLPGSILEIRNNASMTINSSFYMYDVSQWDKYCISMYFTVYNTPFTAHYVRTTANMSQLDDAKLLVDGTCTINNGKYLYATTSGANICGNGGGKLVFSGNLANAKTVYQVKGSETGDSNSGKSISTTIGSTVYLTSISMASANLHNENNTYTKSIASTTFHNVHGRWFAGDAKDADASTHVHSFTYRMGENVGTETENMNAGSDATTPAVYSWDKTGLELRQKWADVSGPTCGTWWTGKGTQATYFYNWSLSSDWHQFLPMASPEGWYSGSNNKLYIKTDCNWEEIGEADENCLYTHEGVKKALVNGVLIELEKNEYDQAYHDKATGENFYICFEGCNWHPAMPYPEELEAYIVDEENFIWKDGEWFSVLRDELFFYTLNEKGIKDYYDYIDGRWQDAQPLVKVTSGDQVWRGYTLLWAVSKANEVNDAVITILNNIKGENNEIIYNRANTTCTLDLNGHTVSGSCAKLLTINAAGSTFTITDNSEEKNGRLENVFNQNATTYNVTVTSGTLNLNAGTIYVENPAQYAAKANADTGVEAALTSCGARGIQVAAAQKLNVTGGRVESHATRNAYGIVATGNAANTTLVTVSGGTIYAEAPYGAYGINSSGKLNVSGGTIEGHLNTAWADGQYTQGSNNDRNVHQYAYGINMTASSNATASSCYYGTLTMTGGTVQATSAWDASYTCNAYGVRIQKALTAVADASKTVDGTHSQKASAIGSITGGTISVDIKGNYAYGVFVEGNYNSYNKTSNTFHISGATITSKAKNYAYGVYANASIDGTCGGYHYGIVELDNSTVTARTTAANAYAVYVASTSSTIFQDKQANYYGEYATAAEMTINSGTYTAVAGSSTAYAATSSTRSKTTYGSETSVEVNRTLGGNAEAYAKLNIHGGTFNATSTTYTARGVSSGGNTTINDATFNVVAGSYNAHGLYSVSGKLTATNVIVNDTAKGQSSNNANAYGVLVDCAIPNGNTAQTGFAYAGEVELNNCTITAVSPSYNNVRALYVNATSRVYNWTQFKADSASYGWAGTADKPSQTYNAYKSVFPCTLQGRDSVGYAIAATATVNGGTFTAKAGKASAYGAVSTQTSVPANKEVTASPVMTLKNATFIAQTGTSTTAYGVQSGGPTLIEGCTVTATAGNATTYQSTASGVRALDKMTTIKNSTITTTATDKAYGLEGYVEINGTHGYCFHGEFDLSEAGNTEVTAEAKTKAKTSYAIYLNATKKAIASGNFAGDYATAANATINGGTYVAKFNTSGTAYVFALGAKQTQGRVVAQPEVEVLDGFFNGATAEVGTAGVVGHMQLKGGYFVHPTNLATYAVAPKSVWTLPKTHEHYDPYKYKVTEHYTITFMNGETQLQQDDLEAGTSPSYSGTPNKEANAQYTYTFDGWSTTDGGDKLAALPAVSEDATYFAHFVQTENKYTVAVAAGANGAVSPASVSKIGCETASADITATPDAGYAFNDWTLPEGVTAATGYTAASTPIRIHATAAGKTITANFVARTDISYTVKHWQQNIENDEYTEVTADQETKQGTTATATAATAKSYTGFTAQPFSQETIAGEGTTVVNIYYDRKTYTITWVDCNGTTIKTDQNVKYGTTPAYTGSTPAKSTDEQYTYTFDGWSSTDGGDKLDELPAVSADATYYAHFSKTENKYTVAVAAGANGAVSPASVSEIGCETASGDITATANAGYSFVNWTIPAGVTLADEYTTSSNPVRIHATAANKTITANFVARTDINYTVKHWQQNIENDEYTEVTADQETKQGTTATATAATAKSYTGFTAQTISQETIAGDGLTVVNIYYNRNTHTITWKNGDDVIKTDENVRFGATPAYNGEIPTKTGYTFAGWSTDESTMPDADLEITASWEPRTDTQYTVEHYWQNIENNDYTHHETIIPTGTTAATVTDAKITYDGFDFKKQEPANAIIAADGSLVIKCYYDRKTYTVTWWDAQEILDNHLIEEQTYKYGATPSYTYDKPRDENYTYEFIRWTPAIEPVTGNKTYTAVYSAKADNKEVSTAETITTDLVAGVTTIHTSGQLNIPAEKSLTTTDFVLEATAEASGELIGDVAADNIYFDLIIGDTESRHWHAFTVPFVVNLKKAGRPIQINGETLTLGRGYDIVYYNGAERAVSGKSAKCWKYVEDGDSILHPGKAYMIASASRAIDVVRFTKYDDEETHISVSENASSTGVDNDGGWNGIGNPKMYHAVLETGATVCQVHDGGRIGADGYNMYDLTGRKLVVGKAVYVQVNANNDNVSVVAATNQEIIQPSPAPRKNKADRMSGRYDVHIAPADGEMADHIYLLTDEDKEDRYVILADLAKAGVSPVRAQMWVDRYDDRLCMNTAVLVNNQADYPLGISVPNAGEYDIYIAAQPEEEAVMYLTLDGKPVWNLSYGGYTATLEKGTTNRYGLRLVKKSSKVPTGMEELTIENGGAVRKVLVNDKVYIIRNGETYTITGQRINQ